MEELISIIVPVYNAEKTLDRCVAALVGQTYRNLEIILVNDGSKDGSLEICRRFAAEDSRIRVIDKPNGGVSSARNAGLDAAGGEFVMFCDSDDWAEPDWCKTLRSAYRPEMLVMCGYFIEGEQTVLPHEIKAKEENELYSKSDFCALSSSGFNVPWNKIYLRSILEDKKIRFDCRIKNGEDYLFNVQYLSAVAGDIHFLNRSVFHYVWPTGDSLSSKVESGDLERCCILFRELQNAIQQFMELESLPNSFYTAFFWQFEKIMTIELDSGNTWSSTYSQMRRIMACEEYQIAAAKSKHYPDKLREKLYCASDPFLLMIFRKGSKMIHRMMAK